MTRALDDFWMWLHQQTNEGQRLLVDDLGISPTEAFYKYDDIGYARDFYARIDRWSAWKMHFVGGIRRWLIDAEHIVAAAETALSTERLLLFRLRHIDGVQVLGIDLRSRDFYLDSSGWGELRIHLRQHRAEPSWKTVRDNIAADLRSLVTELEARPSDLVLAGEPRSPKLADALELLTVLTYVDVGLVRTDLVAAENHFRSRHVKDVGSAFRRAIEQIVNDAYREGVKRGAIPTPASTPDTFSKTEAIGKTLATKATARQAYGAFALLSELGSHPGPITDDELEAAWHSGLAGVYMLARRLQA